VRVVSSRSKEWLTPGIGSTEVAVLLGVSVEKETPLTLWADKVEQRRRKAEGKAVKIVPEEALGQGTPAWLEWRNRGVGGSEVSVLTGDSRFKTPLDLYKLKVGEVADTAENPDMQRGKKLEPTARKLYEDLMGWNSPPLCVLHDEVDYMRCSLDGLREDYKVVLEIKAPRLRGHLKNWDCKQAQDESEAFAYAVPYYYAQVQYQLMLTGAGVCHFVSYSEEKSVPQSQRFCLLSIRPDPEKQALIRRRVEWFWDHVLRKVPPLGPMPD
jgi:putative phage-type endonuclease